MTPLAELVTADRLIDLRASAKRAVLEELVAAIGDLPGQPGVRAVLQAILDREELRPTGIGEGIAIPHCKDARTKSFAVAIGRTEEPIDFGSPDNRPVRIFAMISAPTDQQSAYLRLLSTVTRFLRKEQDAMLKAASLRDLHGALKGY